ncbi:hypothetical protein TELCIR_17698, partial [Teladorsagia circumcincta]
MGFEIFFNIMETVIWPYCPKSVGYHIMSSIRGHKSRLSAAVAVLTRMISSVDSSYLTALDTSTSPEVQLREILRRKGSISAVKFGIERALEILKERHEALQLYVQTQSNSSALSEQVEQFWSELQGDQHEQNAQETIMALETQLMMDEAVETSIRSQLNNNIANATAALTLSSSPPRTASFGNQSLDACSNQRPHQLSFAPSPQPSSIPGVQPIQLRKLELPVFDGDLTQFYDFWCRFKAAIHDNDHLPLASKFIYLSNALKGSAALIVQGFDPSKPENYHLAIQALKKRYDRPQFTHNLFHHRLEQLPTSSISASSQRDTLSQIQSYVLQLNRRISQGRSTPRIPQIGEVVLIGDKSTPRGTWPMAVIIRLSKDRAQQIRSATVRTTNGNELQRSINQLYPLEIVVKEDPQDTSDSRPLRVQPPRAVKRRHNSVSVFSCEYHAACVDYRVVNYNEASNIVAPGIYHNYDSVSFQLEIQFRFFVDFCSELVYRYTRGHYSDEEISCLEDDRSQDISIPPQDRLPLRITQALTQAVNFDTIFSIEHLANRDLFLIDAFLHHSFFSSIREQFVGEATIPSESALDYPPVRSYSLALIVNNFKGLHNSVERLKQFSTDLGNNPSWFQSVHILLDKHQELATLIYNVQSRRNSLADLIFPHVFNPIDDNRDFVDLLAQFHITHSNLTHLLASATTSTSFAYTYLQHI